MMLRSPETSSCASGKKCSSVRLSTIWYKPTIREIGPLGRSILIDNAGSEGWRIRKDFNVFLGFEDVSLVGWEEDSSAERQGDDERKSMGTRVTPELRSDLSRIRSPATIPRPHPWDSRAMAGDKTDA